MAFWGVEVKPGKPFSHQFDQSRGRLHISQATLGIGSSSKKSLVQCNVGDKSPILLCSLIPEKTESCVLDLEFEEMDEVIFSVIGPRSVHLTGYYIGNDAGACGHEGHEDDSDSYGEDIGETESDDSSDYDDDGIKYDDDFIDDDDGDMEMFDPSPKRKSGVVIEEIHDNDKPANANGDPKVPKKKYQVSDPDDNQGQIILKGSTSMWDSETSEDEDGLPKSKAEDGNAEVLNKSDKKVVKGKKKKAEDSAPEQVKGISESESEDEDGLPKSSTSDKKVAKGKKKKAEKGAKQLTGTKRKIQSVTKRGIEEQYDSSIPSTEPNKKKKKERTKKGKTLGDGDNHKSDSNKDSEGQIEDAKIDNIEKDQQDGDKKLPNDECPDIDAKTPGSEDQTDGKKKKKKKNKKNKVPESNENVSKDGEKKGSIAEIAVEKAEVKPSQARSYSNGLAVEELQMGKPDGKRASPGKKVFVRYIGKLKSNGKIFYSNVRGPPFKFRLGVGEVIKGWDVGVNGMRVGDKRRITVPPAMGYGTKGAGGQIPPNAWLVFDVELVDVR